jgi:hypothetical protein
MESRADSEIQRQVESELFACPDVDETDIAVKVIDGTGRAGGARAARNIDRDQRDHAQARSARYAVMRIPNGPLAHYLE